MNSSDNPERWEQTCRWRILKISEALVVSRHVRISISRKQDFRRERAKQDLRGFKARSSCSLHFELWTWRVSQSDFGSVAFAAEIDDAFVSCKINRAGRLTDGESSGRGGGGLANGFAALLPRAQTFECWRPLTSATLQSHACVRVRARRSLNNERGNRGPEAPLRPIVQRGRVRFLTQNRRCARCVLSELFSHFAFGQNSQHERVMRHQRPRARETITLSLSLFTPPPLLPSTPDPFSVPAFPATLQPILTRIDTSNEGKIACPFSCFSRKQTVHYHQRNAQSLRPFFPSPPLEEI